MKSKSVVLFALAATLGFATLAAAGGGKECEHAPAKAASAQPAAIDQQLAQRAAHGWLGFEATKDEATGAYSVIKVVAGSPASQAGFREGDILVALNGIALNAQNKEQLKAAKASLAVGQQVHYTVRRAGNERQLTATLAPVPQRLLAQWRTELVKEQGEQMAQAGN